MPYEVFLIPFADSGGVDVTVFQGIHNMNVLMWTRGFDVPTQISSSNPLVLVTGE